MSIKVEDLSFERRFGVVSRVEVLVLSCYWLIMVLSFKLVFFYLIVCSSWRSFFLRFRFCSMNFYRLSILEVLGNKLGDKLAR